MDLEDLEPKTKKPKLRDLEPMSIEALGDYIAEMETEIERVKAEIEKKKAARAGAEAFFKS